MYPPVTETILNVTRSINQSINLFVTTKYISTTITTTYRKLAWQVVPKELMHVNYVRFYVLMNDAFLCLAVLLFCLCIIRVIFRQLIDKTSKQEGRLCNEQQHKNVQIAAPLRSAVEISHLQQQASLMATVGDYDTNGNARTNILSITAGCTRIKEYICSSQFIEDSVTTLLRAPSRLGRGWNLGIWFSGKSLKLLPTDARF